MRNRTICAQIYALVIIACLSWGTLSAKQVEGTKDKSRLSIKFREQVYDFGVITPAQKVTHLFKFQNLSRKALKINRVTTSCGCTAVVVSTGTVPPGGIGEIKVTFDPKGHLGSFQKMIYVHSNDPEQPVVALQIRGFVKPEIYVLPRRLDFGELKRGTSVDTQLVVFDERGKGAALEITKVKSDMRYIHLTSGRPQSQQVGKVIIPIRMALNSLTPVGKLQGRIRLWTNIPERPVIVIPVSVDVIDEIATSPERIFFGFVPQGSTPSRKIIVYSRWNLRFKVLKVESTLPFVAVEVSPIEEKRRYEIVVSMKKDAPKGRAEGAVKIYTDYLNQPVIEVPVVALIGR